MRDFHTLMKTMKKVGVSNLMMKRKWLRFLRMMMNKKKLLIVVMIKTKIKMIDLNKKTQLEKNKQKKQKIHRKKIILRMN